MKIPLKITFRNMEPSKAIEDNIREKAAKLDSLCDRIMSCRVTVEAPHRHHHGTGADFADESFVFDGGGGETFTIAVRPSIDEADILSLNVAQIVKRPSKRLERW